MPTSQVNLYILYTKIYKDNRYITNVFKGLFGFSKIYAMRGKELKIFSGVSTLQMRWEIFLVGGLRTNKKIHTENNER